jgi:hypothetical protein
LSGIGADKYLRMASAWQLQEVQLSMTQFFSRTAVGAIVLDGKTADGITLHLTVTRTDVVET